MTAAERALDSYLFAFGVTVYLGSVIFVFVVRLCCCSHEPTRSEFLGFVLGLPAHVVFVVVCNYVWTHGNTTATVVATYAGLACIAALYALGRWLCLREYAGR